MRYLLFVLLTLICAELHAQQVCAFVSPSDSYCDANGIFSNACSSTKSMSNVPNSDSILISVNSDPTCDLLAKNFKTGLTTLLKTYTKSYKCADGTYDQSKQNCLNKSCPVGYFFNSQLNSCNKQSYDCPSNESLYVPISTKLTAGQKFSLTGSLMNVGGCQAKVEAVICGIKNGVQSCELSLITTGKDQNGNGSPSSSLSEYSGTMTDCIKSGGSFGYVNNKSVCISGTELGGTLSYGDGSGASSSGFSSSSRFSSGSSTGVGTVNASSTFASSVLSSGTIYGGTVTTKIESSGVSVNVANDIKIDFCSTNPSSSLCKQSKVDASCDAFSCDADAAQCAIAKAVWQNNCTTQQLNQKNEFSEAATIAIATNDTSALQN